MREQRTTTARVGAFSEDRSEATGPHNRDRLAAWQRLRRGAEGRLEADPNPLARTDPGEPRCPAELSVARNDTLSIHPRGRRSVHRVT
jgi:hypothetical protein